MKTRDQQYAETIFRQVGEFKQLHTEREQKHYGSMAHRLPVLIRSAGLAQALSFVDARGKDAQKELLTHLEATIYDGRNEKPNKLLSRSRSASVSEYMQLTQNAVSALLWYKRFAQSVLGVEAGDESETYEES